MSKGESLRPITHEMLPDNVVTYFEQSSHPNPQLRVGVQAFKNLWMLDGEAVVSYVGRYDRRLDEDDLGVFDDTVTHMIDVAEDGRIAGSTNAKYRHTKGDANDSGITSIQTTETFGVYKRQGLAKRRVITLDGIAQEFDGSPLHSAPMWDRSEDATGFWRHMVERGDAEEYLDHEGSSRFRMKSRSE